MNNQSKTGMSFLIFGTILLYIPILFLIFFSFSESSICGVWSKFSLKWFKAVFEDDDLLMAAVTSIKIAFFSACGSTILGLVAAIATTRSGKLSGKDFLIKSMNMPIIMPEIIMGFSLLMLFITIEKYTKIKISRGVATVTMGHIMASMSYVHMTVRSRLLMIEQTFEESALNLGANPFKAFVFVTIPMISNSILAGWLLAFTLSLDDLVIASFLSGPGATTLPMIIFSNARIGITPTINAFSTMFVVIIALCITTTSIISRRKWKSQTSLL